MFHFLLFLTPIEDARNLTYHGNYQESIKILEKQSQNSDYYYLMAVNNFFLNNKQETEKWLDKLDDEFNLPRRYRVLSIIMRDDLDKWKKNDLGDISRDMRNIGSRLKNNKSGKETQKLQQEVLAKLDKMIKEKEQQQEDQKIKQAQKEKEQQEKNQEQNLQPKTDSNLPIEAALGKVDPKKLKAVVAKWGELPEKERCKAMLELTRDMPAKYKDAIEYYLKNISARSDKK